MFAISVFHFIARRNCEANHGFAFLATEHAGRRYLRHPEDLMLEQYLPMILDQRGISIRVGDVHEVA